MVVETHVVVLHLEPFWHLLLFQTHYYQPSGSIKSNACHTIIKWKIWVDHYKCDTNLKYFQTWVILCIRFCFIWGWRVQSKKNRIKLLHLHHVMISTMMLLSNTIRFGFVPIYRRKNKLKNVDAKFQVEVGY